MISTALQQIPVGVVVARHRAKSPWLDYVCAPVSVLLGVPQTAPWTVISSSPEVTHYYAGEALIELHRTETAGYRDNLASGSAVLWVVLRPAGGDQFDLLTVTADPAEGEALTGAGDDLIATVPMPPALKEIIAAFVARHHVEQPFFKRVREKPAGGAADAGRSRKGDVDERE